MGGASRTGHRHPRVLRLAWVEEYMHDSFCPLSHNPLNVTPFPSLVHRTRR